MEKVIIEPIIAHNSRLVKSEDLNHHGTLFAGRTAEWFVESGFLSAALILNPKNVVCLKIHGMYFTKPVKPGQILKFESKIVYAGNTSLVSYIEVVTNNDEKPYVSGFITFIHVDQDTKPLQHNIVISPVTEKDIELYDKAKNLKNN